MGILIRFNTPKPKKFDIAPRYHDPKKEEREARERRIKKELGIKGDDNKEGYQADIKGQFKEEAKRIQFKSSHRRRSNLLVLLIFLLLALAAYHFLSKYSFF